MTVTLLQGDCLSVLATLPDQSVQCCVTSPPYYGLRDYGTAKWQGGDPECSHKRETKVSACGETGSDNVSGGIGDAIQKTVCAYCGAIRIDSQIGLEPTPDAYVAKLVAVFREVRRVLRDDGTLWLNLGDSYAGSGGAGGDYSLGGLKEGQPKWKSNLDVQSAGLKPKDIIGIPWMVAFALRADGWFLRQDIIWHKPNPMPESVKDRCTKAHEYIFLLAKSQKYYYDYQAILEPANYDGRKDTMFKGSVKNYDGVNPGGQPQSFAQEGHERWTYKLPPIGGKKHVGKNGNPTYSGNTPEIQRMGKDGSGFAGHSGNYDKDGNLLTHEKDGIPARNKRTVWTVTTKPFKGAHFATFPPDLIEPCILAGTSEKGACPKCGKPWARIVEREKPPKEVFTKNGKPEGIAAISHPEIGKVGMGQKLQDWHNEHPQSTVAWQPTCECGLEPVPCVVLDPFNGAGTTGLVAIQHGRDYIGIDLNPDYIEMTHKRLASVQVEMI